MLPVLPFFGLLTGCAPDTVQFLPDLWASTWETDTGAPDRMGWLAIDHANVDWFCDASGFELQLYTQGPAGGGSLHLYGPDTWTEAHQLQLRDASPDGAWDRYTVGPLADRTPETLYLPGVNTRFSCGVTEPTAIVRLDDRFGELADCLVMGTLWPSAEAVLQEPEFADFGGCGWQASY